MASSGNAVFTLTRNQLIAESYRKARVTAEGQAPSPTQISEAASRLNMVIKNCMSNGLPLWTYQQYVVPLVPGQVQYQMHSSGLDPAMGTITRPLRIFEYGNFIRNNTPVPPVDTPVRMISRQEYMNYGSKFSPGVVNAFYYDSKIELVIGPNNQTSPSAGWGNLFVYVQPNSANYTLYLNGQRPLFDMDTADDEFDFPAEWFMYLMYALAAEILDDNEGSEQRIARLESKADSYREKLMDWSVETASSSFAPAYFPAGY